MIEWSLFFYTFVQSSETSKEAMPGATSKTEITAETRVVCKDSSGYICDVKLSKTDNGTQFCCDLTNGRIGYNGVTRKHSFPTQESAIALFTKQFLGKTGFEWKGPSATYKWSTNTYRIIKHVEPDEKPQRVAKKRTLKVEKPMENLEEMSEVFGFLSIVCDEKKINQTLQRQNFGKPIRTLSVKQINGGFRTLRKIETALKKKTSVAELTNEYYSNIPHCFGMSVPPKIDNLEKVKAEFNLLNSLSGAMELVGDMENVKSDDKGLLKQAATYNAPTHHFENMKFSRAFRFGEKLQPTKRRRAPAPAVNTLLLWHGSPVTNIYSIMLNGLSRPEFPRGNLMFGPGIYFATLASKSLLYCNVAPGEKVYLFLCKVNLGDSLVLTECDYDPATVLKKKKKNSVLGKGLHSSTSFVEIDGIQVTTCVENRGDVKSALLYDEYVVYDESAVSIAYVVELVCTEPE
ncbi:unnamed protein product [Caenorhabditis auriculariae]|uniref:Poly [ADP-ribose] polymerase n=1 Tax=Caenorhabditis auriculariae TaxID=2777116 RepID=A0A8S1H3P3_9PELO|nr:unnamed protein product [Caenorhabditis auriculariae]